MIVTAVQRLLRFANLELHRSSSALNEEATLRRLLVQQDISTVLDVGANIGQYGRSVRSLGFAGRLISFEALKDAHATLVERSKGDAMWSVAPRAAVGAENGEIQINVSDNSVSSSVLPMLDVCVASAPQARYVRSESTALRRLDELIADFSKVSAGQGRPLIQPDDRLFLKLDTQGYEAQVLAGATNTLKQVFAIQSEVSLTPLYQNAPTIESMIALVKSLGFEPFSIAPGFADKASGRLLQCDVFFIRADSSTSPLPS